jgi:hypothetical protein
MAMPRQEKFAGVVSVIALDEAVNKLLLSTGESRELVIENMRAGLNPES